MPYLDGECIIHGSPINIIRLCTATSVQPPTGGTVGEIEFVKLLLRIRLFHSHGVERQSPAQSADQL